MHNRPDREITQEPEIIEILRNGKFCSIALCNDNKPYLVTLSYGYTQEKNALYFHCATKGLKLEFIAKNPEVCATIIEDGGYVMKECAHNYKTVVFWGKLQVVTDKVEKEFGMRVLLKHLEKENTVVEEKIQKAFRQFTNMEILRLDIQEIHAKAGR